MESVRRDTKSCSACWMASALRTTPAANLVCKCSSTLLPCTSCSMQPAGCELQSSSASRYTCSCASWLCCKDVREAFWSRLRGLACGSGSVMIGAGDPGTRLCRRAWTGCCSRHSCPLAVSDGAGSQAAWCAGCCESDMSDVVAASSGRCTAAIRSC